MKQKRARIISICSYLYRRNTAYHRLWDISRGKSSLMIYEKYANLKYKYGNRHFWCRGYYVSTVGRNRRAIEEYIRNQHQEDYTDDQLSIKEFVDPFTGEPVKGGK